MLYTLLLCVSGFVAVSSLTCPSCSRVGNLTVCNQKSEICEANDDVCLGKLEEWKFSVMCSTSLLCPNELFHGSVNCTGGLPFKPHDDCTSCCTGPDCPAMLNAVQRGFNAIPTVLHCPICHGERDPAVCMNNILPCDDVHNTCSIHKKHGHYTAKCETSHKCLHHYHNHPAFPACFHDQHRECIICCHNRDCISQVFGVQMATPPPATSAPGVTVHPPGCFDSPFYPCAPRSCADDNIAVTFCPWSCNRCSDLQTTTTSSPSAQCVDSDEFPCSTFSDICADTELAKLHCPKMCNLCT